MAKYHVVPGGRIDNVNQAVKRIGRQAAMSASIASVAGASMGAGLGPTNAVKAGAMFGLGGGLAEAANQTVKEVKQHRALRKEQFKG
ncbi:hypothetical protein UFOVP46_110 [uncultured Caudovirales phage]|uniref:Uncharacterized protein n=1 Tax=uncultured Caudovirales phage TaxID=2100421 RepID=A0A6J5KRJ1_9CAUD|nr:hypothetical protein UFOVP46_110 [uncultured Caudovirales phage]